MKKSPFKFLSLAGVIGPVLFTLITVICASLRPGYSHISQFISELGATGSPNAQFMNFAGFIPTGLMIAMFGVSLYLLLSKHLLTRTGSVFITVFGLGIVVAGLFSCDIGCPREGSIENNIHDTVSGPIFLIGIIGILLHGISFRRQPSFRSIWFFSVVSALLAFTFMVALVNSFETYTTTGFWQRLLLATIFLWCGIVGMKLYKSSQDISAGES